MGLRGTTRGQKAAARGLRKLIGQFGMAGGVLGAQPAENSDTMHQME